MRPEQRLDQIEPILAEVLQKVDRLIDSQGRILDEVSKITGIEGKIAGIETEVYKIAGIEGRIAGIEGKVTGIETEVAKIAGIEANTALTARAVATLTVDIREFKEEVRNGFKEFEHLKVSQEKMENSQQEILALLRSRS